MFQDPQNTNSMDFENEKPNPLTHLSFVLVGAWQF